MIHIFQRRFERTGREQLLSWQSSRACDKIYYIRKQPRKGAGDSTWKERERNLKQRERRPSELAAERGEADVRSNATQWPSSAFFALTLNSAHENQCISAISIKSNCDEYRYLSHFCRLAQPLPVASQCPLTRLLDREPSGSSHLLAPTLRVCKSRMSWKRVEPHANYAFRRLYAKLRFVCP